MAVFTRAVLVMVFLFMMISFSQGREYLVGGRSDAWSIPSSPSHHSLNQWAQSSRFLIGDYLVWKYDSGKDSVLQVTKKDYVTCNTTSPVKEYKDGNNTKVELHKSGPFYFISGAQGHCEKGQKLVVVVISLRHHPVTSFAPAPSPTTTFGAPAVAPTSGATSLSVGLVGSLTMLLFFV